MSLPDDDHFNGEERRWMHGVRNHFLMQARAMGVEWFIRPHIRKSTGLRPSFCSVNEDKLKEETVDTHLVIVNEQTVMEEKLGVKSR